MIIICSKPNGNGFHSKFYKISPEKGVKLFMEKSSAELSRTRQFKAFMLNVGPEVKSRVMETNMGWGYLTEIAEPVLLKLKLTTRDNWQDNLDNSEFEKLVKTIHSIMPNYQDSHYANLGSLRTKLVCIDFFDG